MPLGEAIGLYGNSLTIAATGAIAKKGMSTSDVVRVIYDGTNGVYLNYGIDIRDQVQFPRPLLLSKPLWLRCVRKKGTHCVLAFDVSKTHRRIPLRPVRGFGSSHGSNTQSPGDGQHIWARQEATSAA